MPNGTLPKKWHLKCHESVHILTGLYDHLKEYKKIFSKELVNSKCLKKLKIKFWENEYITKKVKFSWTNCLYIWDQQKILILLKILLEVAYFFKFFQYRKGALCIANAQCCYPIWFFFKGALWGFSCLYGIFSCWFQICNQILNIYNLFFLLPF